MSQPSTRLSAAGSCSTGTLARLCLAVKRDRIVQPRTDAAREISRRAVERDETASTVRTVAIVDLFVGALFTHWETTLESDSVRRPQKFVEYAESLVKIILAGAASPSSPG